MTRRTNFWRYFVDQYGDLGRDENLDACLQSMRTYKRLVVLDLDFERLRREFVDGPRTYGRLYALLQAQVAERRGKGRWGDKSLNIETYTDRILTDFPEARILHMIRDPRDRLASVLARWRVRRGDIGAGTAAWLWSARLGAQHAANRPGNYMVVRYEWLVQAPEAAAREILRVHRRAVLRGDAHDGRSRPIPRHRVEQLLREHAPSAPSPRTRSASTRRSWHLARSPSSRRPPVASWPHTATTSIRWRCPPASGCASPPPTGRTTER